MITPIIIERHIDGANGRNWPGFVMLDPRAHYKAAILAQEWYEAVYKLNPWHAFRVLVSDNAKRRMEIIGHEMEVQAAHEIYNAPVGKYRWKEAERMKAGYDGLFDQYSLPGLVYAMKQHEWCRRWVLRRLRKLREYK